MSLGQESQSGGGIEWGQRSQARIIIFIAQCFNWKGGYQLVKYKISFRIFE